MGLVDPSKGLGIARRAAGISLVSTILVVAAKLVAAWLSGSVSVLAEALQSTLDVFMSALALWTIGYAAKPPDEDHPYGHGKAEVLSSAFQMLVVLGSIGFIVWIAGKRLMDPQPVRPDWGLVAMGYAVVADSAVILYLRRVVGLTGSAALAGEAEHLRGDVLSSLGVFGGLVAMRVTNLAVLDPIVALVFAAISGYFALRHLRRSVHPLMDGAIPSEDLAEIRRVLAEHPHVRDYHNLRTREAGKLRTVTIHVLLDDDMTFVEAHDMAEHIEDELGAALGGALVTVHYEPYEAETVHRSEAHGDPPRASDS